MHIEKIKCNSQTISKCTGFTIGQVKWQCMALAVQSLYFFYNLYFEQKPLLAAIGVAVLTAVVAYFFGNKKSKKRLIALDPQKKIAFELVDKQV